MCLVVVVVVVVAIAVVVVVVVVVAFSYYKGNGLGTCILDPQYYTCVIFKWVLKGRSPHSI